jgi:hypothetical protein
MNSGTKIALAVVGGLLTLLVVLVVSLGGLYVSNHNRAVDLESQVVAQYEDMRNTMSNYTLKLQEMIQVTDIYKEDLRDIVEATFTGRYGEDGSQAMFQWIQEQNIQLDASVYKNIQVTMESGRTEFQNKQTRLLDTKRIYQKELNSFVSGFFMRLAGYPEIDLDKYHIIVEESTQQKFENGTDSAVQLR